MKKIVVLGLVFALVLTSLTGTIVSAKPGNSVLLVPENYATIQEAVNAASDGAVIKVAEGIYTEQVEIRDLNNIQLTGDGATITVPVGGMTGQLVKVVNCENIRISDFIIDGDNGSGVAYGARNSGGDTDTRFYGIFFVNSSGHITGNTVQDVSWGNGVQQGLGISVVVDDGLARSINIIENTITNFQKNGITIIGLVKAKIHKNVVTGWGDTAIIAQNCIQLGGHANMTASVTNNLISDSFYTPMNWASTGILALNGNDNIRIVNNIINNTMVGVYVYPGSTNCKIIANSGLGNLWDYYSYEDDTKAHANKFE